MADIREDLTTEPRSRWEPPPAASGSETRGASHTTRVLCSAILADHGFAEPVFQKLCVPGVAAIAPSPGVDLVALARHAAHALDERRHTHVALYWMLAAFVIPIAGFYLAPDLGGFWWLAILALVVGAKVRAVRGDLALARRATDTIDGVDVDRTVGAGLVHLYQERRLAEANSADVSVYASARASNPFPGLGQRVDAKVLAPVGIDQPGDPDQPLGHGHGDGPAPPPATDDADLRTHQRGHRRRRHRHGALCEWHGGPPPRRPTARRGRGAAPECAAHPGGRHR
jgi:hypothetical protein